MRISDNGVDRDMTDEEVAAYTAAAKITESEAKELAALVAAKADARQAVLDKLGLSANEAQALLG